MKWMMPLFGLLVAIAELLYTSHIASKNIEANGLFLLTDAITTGYRGKQIFVSVVLFVAGFLAAQAIFISQTDAMKAVWALPISIATWCACSIIVLLCRLPYVRVLMFVITAMVLCTLVYIRREYVKKINLTALCRGTIWCAALSIFFSTGITPTLMSSDSYYYVMQYGEVIARVGELSFDTAGSTMTWTGVSSALISSLAVFCGFETITVIHYLLVVSLIGCFFLTMRAQVVKLDISKRYANTVASIFTVCLIVVPAFELLSSWIISNAYCMVYIFFLMIGIKMYTEEERENKILLVLLSTITCWLAMSRAEMSVCVAFVICIMSILPLTRRDMFVLSVPTMLAQLLFLIELDLQQAISSKSVYDSMLTPSIQAIMVVATVGAVTYSAFIDSKAFAFIRSSISIIVFLVLPIACALIYFIDKDKYITSIKSIIYNFRTQYWGLLPIMVVILYVVLIFHKKLNYWMVYSTGYLLINLAMCLGRKQALRDGYGDSCNRIMMSAIPIVLFAMISSVLEIVSTYNNQSIEKDYNEAQKR